MAGESMAQMAHWTEAQQAASDAALEAKFKATQAVGARINAALEGKEIPETRRTIQEWLAILSETSKDSNAKVQPNGWKISSLMNMGALYLNESDTSGHRRRRGNGNQSPFEYTLATQLLAAERMVAHQGRNREEAERVSWLARARAQLQR